VAGASTPQRPRSCHPQYTLEFVAGGCAGAVGGFLERPCRYFARQHTFNVLRLVTDRAQAFQGTFFAVSRQGLSHAIFFSTFSWANHTLQYNLFLKPGHWIKHHTSMNEALVMSGAGCVAGAGFRLVTVPMQNVHNRCFKERTRLESPRAFAQRGAAQCWKIAFSGLGTSLAFTMPVTGFAFLAYEMALLHL
jgi:hypothetical protein